MHAQSCKLHCQGGVKVALGGRFAALCWVASRIGKSQKVEISIGKRLESHRK